ARAAADRVLGGGLRRAVPRLGLAPGRGGRVQQALVGVLAGPVAGPGAGGVPGSDGLDHIDLIYSEVPPDGVDLEDAVGMITGLIRTGAARAWGTLNWTPDQMERAWQIADREGVPGPVATQPPYSLVRREIVDDPAMRRLAADRGVAIVASYTLAGGILTGKYDEEPGAGRAAGMIGQPQ